MESSVDPHEIVHYSSGSTLFALYTVSVSVYRSEKIKVDGYSFMENNSVKIGSQLKEKKRKFL